jgi:hypothetical protein
MSNADDKLQQIADATRRAREGLPVIAERYPSAAILMEHLLDVYEDILAGRVAVPAPDATTRR